MNQVTDEPYGRTIARLRNARGWTQEMLAEKSGVPIRTIQAIEGGTTGKPQEATRTALALALDLNGEAADERADWPKEVQVFLDVIGAFLAAMPEGERIRFISGINHWIAMSGRNSKD